jgi:HlyD family secretion protein
LIRFCAKWEFFIPPSGQTFFQPGRVVSHPHLQPSDSSQPTKVAPAANGSAPGDAISERLGSLRLQKSHFVPNTADAGSGRNFRRWIASTVVATAVLLLLFLGWSIFRQSPLDSDVDGGQIASAGPTEVVAITAVSGDGGDGPRMSLSGYVVAESKVQVPVKVTGTVVELPIVEGSQVSAGDLLVRIDSQQYAIDLKEAQASVKIAKAQLDELNEGTRSEDIEQMRANFEQAEAQRDLAQKEYDRAKKLAGSLSEAELDKSKSTVLEAEAHLKQIRYALKLSESGARSEQIAAAEGELERAQAVLEKAQYLLDCTRVVAETDGTILQKFVEPGESIRVDPATGASTVCVMANLHNLLAEVDVQERDLEHVAIGQSCRVSPEAAPELIYEARVERRAPVVNRQRGVVQVKVRILDADERLMPDMSCKVTFLSGTVSDGVEIPELAVVKQGTSPVIFVLDGAVARQRAVTIGKKHDQMVEIASGLRPGEKVLVSRQPLVDGQSVHCRVK